ncbi:hypothetical protein [Fodinicola acaciae]|nr:hypothetical protein [Fodinicola acaciae]
MTLSRTEAVVVNGGPTPESDPSALRQVTRQDTVAEAATFFAGRK